MGAGRKTHTIIVQEKTLPNYTVNSSAPAKNLAKGELRGVIFGCRHVTIAECFKKGLFGLPEPHYTYVKKIVPGMPLFLFNYSDRKLHGIFEATSCGHLNIDPNAWTENGSDSSPFSAQVRFRIQKKCQPLVEDQFNQILSENYYDDKHFWFELDEEQTDMLRALFSSLPDRSSTSIAGEDVVRRHNASWSRLDLPQVDSWEDLVDNEQAPKDELELEMRDNLIHDPQPKKAEHMVAQSSSARLFSSAMSGLNASCPQKSWSALFKNEVPRGKTKGAKDTDFDLAIDECNLVFSKNSNTSRCLDTKMERLEAVKETKSLEDEHLSSYSQHNSSLSSPGVMAALENFWKDVPACEHVESEMKTSDLLSTVAKLSLDLETMKSLHSMQADKISSLEQKLDKSERKFKKLEEWFHKLHTTITPIGLFDEDESDSYSKLDNDIHPKLDESIFIVGGFDDSRWLSCLVSYSPSKDLMTFLPDMTGPRSYASAVNLTGEICIIGGVYHDEWYNTVELYSPVSKSWTSLPSLHRKKGALASIFLEGKIFTVGGGTRQEYFSEVEMLDPNAGRWIPMRSMLHKRFATAAAEVNGVLYAVGGHDGRDYLKSTERYDPREHSWTRISDMNMKRGWHSLVVLNEKLYALGGHDGNSIVSGVEVFEPRVGSWIIERPMHIPRLQFGAAAIGDVIYVFGGETYDSRKVETVECYRADHGWLTTSLKGFGKRCAFAVVVM